MTIYLKHFGLAEPPFNLTPDTDFLFSSKNFQQALNTLLFALEFGEGFIKITGEVGVGKTHLLRKLLRTLDNQKYLTACILPNPEMEPEDFYRMFATEIGLTLEEKGGYHDFMAQFTRHMISLGEAGKMLVLLVDEAQSLSDRTLESLRLLSNFETEKYKFLQVVLFAQPELDDRLANSRIRQLRQRISFAHTMKPLSSEETHQYLEHRLRVAGATERVFHPAASRLIYSYSQGTPRVIHIIAHKSMMVAFGEGKKEVQKSHVQTAMKDSEWLEMASPWSLRGLFHRLRLFLTLGRAV
ncbi:MAG: AAA family ATPase [Magnetococcales bacterium]|nr:AAA family ATPase [Magnetococcales bacterium]NGZ28024.1 AAA family ATPase [Magnetococcales bacterium]